MGKLKFVLLLALPIAVFAAGSGTKADPYTISSAEELVQFRDAVNAGDNSFNGADMSHGGAGLYFKLVKPVDLSKVCGADIGNWAPIGIDSHPFLGHFDGGSNAISNLYVDGNNPEFELVPSSGYGLFGFGSSSGEDTLTISNVVVESSSISVNSNTVSVGGVLGFAVGDVVIENSVNKASVSGRMAVGGIVGKIDDGNTVVIRDCENYGKVDAGYGYGAGIAGYLSVSSAVVSGCVNKSDLVQGGDYAAGIVGRFYSVKESLVKSCENLSSISSGNASAGIAIYGRNVSFESVYNGAHVQASTMAAGIIDSVENGSFSMCVNEGELFAGTLAGGITAFDLSRTSSYEKCLNLGVITGMQYAGGIVAIAKQNSESEVSFLNCINVGEIDGSEKGTINGLCGAGTCTKKYNLDTTNLAVEKLPEGFVESEWVLQKGYYPQIKELAVHSSERIRKASLKAATAKDSPEVVAGLGSKDDPLTIESLAEFLQFRDAVNDSSEYKGVKLADGAKGLWFSLLGDIDLSSVCGKNAGNWKPIGPFAGNFDGNGHSISNLYMGETYNGAAGLFGALFANGDTLFIKNLKLDKVVMEFESKVAYVGAVASQAVVGNVVISDVTVEGLDVSLKGDGIITNAYTAFLGGIMGNTVANGVRVNNSSVYGSITAWGSEVHIGGVMGAAPNAIALYENEVDVDINVANSSGDFGGLVGEMVAKYEVVGNVNKGDIKADSLRGYAYVGGIFGVNPYAPDGSVLSNCENTGTIEASGTELSVGGIAGFLVGGKDGTVSNLTNEGAITVTSFSENSQLNVGGIAGIYNVVKADSLVNKASITVKNVSAPRAGGIAGFVRDLSDSLTIVDCENRGDILVRNDNENEDDWTVYVAGLIGNAGPSKVVSVKGKSVAEGKISVDGMAKLRAVFAPPAVYVDEAASIVTDEDFVDKVEVVVKDVTPKSKMDDGKKDVVVGKNAPVGVAVGAQGMNLLISRGTPGAKFSVFDMQGNLVRVGVVSSGVTEVRMPSAGRFVVKVGVVARLVTVK